MPLVSQAEQIVNAIASHIRTVGGSYSAWHCGIAADPNERLLDDHNAGGKDCHARHWNCSSEIVARQLEKRLLDAGCQGGRSGGDHNTKFVDVYKITGDTLE